MIPHPVYPPLRRRWAQFPDVRYTYLVRCTTAVVALHDCLLSCTEVLLTATAPRALSGRCPVRVVVDRRIEIR